MKIRAIIFRLGDLIALEDGRRDDSENYILFLETGDNRESEICFKHPQVIFLSENRCHKLSHFPSVIFFISKLSSSKDNKLKCPLFIYHKFSKYRRLYLCQRFVIIKAIHKDYRSNLNDQESIYENGQISSIFMSLCETQQCLGDSFHISCKLTNLFYGLS